MIFTLNRDKSRRLIEGLTEPAIIVRGASVVMSNRAARNLLGVAIEGVDVRQVLPHPALIERLVRGRLNGPEDVEAGLVGRDGVVLHRLRRRVLVVQVGRIPEARGQPVP